MPPRRSLLYLAREYPFPLNAAPHLRTFNWLLHLSQRFQVTLVAPSFHDLSDMESQALEGRCQRVVVVPLARKPQWRYLPQRIVHAMQSVFTGLPADAQSLVSGGVANAVRQLVSQQRFDVAFAERWTQVDLASSAAPFVMLDAGELQTPRLLNALSGEHNPLRRWWASWGAGRQLRTEIEALRRFHLILLNSVRARREVESYLGTNGSTLVLPEGLNTDHFAPRRGSFNPRRIVFHSSLESFNQQDALHSLRENILPRVRRRFGDLRLSVISARCPAELREQLQSDPDVEFLGAVDDPRPILRSAALAVLPLRLGRGSRSRLIQLLSMGVPVVATPLATAGLDIASGDGVLLAKEEAAFADAMLQVLEDSSLRRDLSARGRSLAESRLSLHATYGHLTDVLSRVSLDLHGTLR
jgi:glycosyltransferase involved in cell wall biosynthesis